MDKKKLIAKLFHIVFSFIRPMTLGVRIIVEDKEGKVLLVKQTYTDGWFLPGGGVEIGETCAEAAIKEVMEEGLIRIIGEPTLLSVHQNKSLSRRDHVVLYHTKDWETVGEFTPNREISHAEFHDPNNLPKDATKATIQHLGEFFKALPKDPYW